VLHARERKQQIITCTLAIISVFFGGNQVEKSKSFRLHLKTELFVD